LVGEARKKAIAKLAKKQKKKKEKEKEPKDEKKKESPLKKGTVYLYRSISKKRKEEERAVKKRQATNKPKSISEEEIAKLKKEGKVTRIPEGEPTRRGAGAPTQKMRKLTPQQYNKYMKYMREFE
ncbi:uncharacterized protein METZ01_LOCUS473370, partial [marine metagenome]